MIGLWSASTWLMKRKKNYFITLLPSVFMTLVSVNYIVMAPEGFGAFFGENKQLAATVGFGSAVAVAVVFLVLFFNSKKRANV